MIDEDKLNALELFGENEYLHKEIERLKIIEEKYKDSQLYIKDFKDEIERLNNDIKELLKENSNKEKVIIAQDNIIKEVREYIENKVISNGEVIDQLRKIEVKELLEILNKGDD